MIATLLAAAFFLLFTGFGARVCRLLGVSFESRAQEWAFCGGLGMGLASYAVLLVGLAGGMRPVPLAVLCGVLTAVAVGPAWRMLWRDVRALLPLELPLLFVFAALLITFIGVLGPEIGNDALCYHLNCPKLFLMQGHISVIQYDQNSHYPFLLQNLYGLGLAFDGPSLAKSFHWMTGLLAALGLYGIARKDLGRRGGLIAAAVFLLCPGMLNQMGIAYVDVGLVCFSFLSLYAFTLYLEGRDWRQALLSGCFLGFALSIKHLALISMAVFGLIALGYILARNARGFLRGIPVFFLFAGIFSIFWYARSWIVFGNPVHPFYGELFGVPLLPMAYHGYGQMGTGRSLLSLVMLPWNITLHPLKFEDFVAQVGPVFLAFAPGLLFVRVWPARWKILGAYTVLFTLFWFFLGQNMRFWYPALAPLCVLTAAAVMRVGAGRGASYRLYQVVFVLFLTMELALGIYHHRRDLSTFWSNARKEAYLEGSERTFRTAQWMNANLPAGSKILNADETHSYYLRFPSVRDSLYVLWTKYDQKAQSPDDVTATLKKEGFTHVLHVITVHTPKQQARQGPLRVEKLINDPATRDRLFRLLHREAYEGRDGEKAEYFVYEIR